ncbi:MAG: helix-turn-helix transcriptional regulator [Ruminococcaceae bacterium]|nr:helix-turn-helix transcriptional regulator [Oscillospiraceae bacterium]
MSYFMSSDIIKSTLRDNIVSRRNLNGWTQSDLAEFIGMKPSTYSNKEAKGNFKIEELLAIADALKVSVNDILHTEVTRLHEAEPQIEYNDSEIILTAKERAVIQLMRSANKKDKAFLINIINYLHSNPNIDDDKAEEILELLKK